MNILGTENLTKRFNGIAAVNDLSIQIKSGEITGIIGPNGSGKTTLTNILSGMLPITHGSIVIRDVSLRAIHAYDVASYGITRTFQEVRLFNQMPVLDNILLALTERNVFGAFFETHGAFHLKRAEELLQEVGLWGKRHELAVNLSYGQRKLLEVARALAMNSEIYIFDEPFAGMFPEMVKIVSNILKALRSNGKTIILIEHNMDLIRELADQVIVMDGGELLSEGPPHDVLSRHEVMEAYLGE